MKQVIILIFIVPLLLSCGKSKESKAAAFAEKEVKKTLNYPESYESVELQVDSAFTSLYIDSEALQAAEKIVDLGNKINHAKSDYDSEKSTAALWSGPYMGAYGKEHVRQAKEKMAQAEEDIERYNKEIEENIEIIKRRNEEVVPGVFYGWGIAHRFRCANKQGEKSLYDILLICDKDFENLILTMDKYDTERFKRYADVMNEALQ